MKKAMASAMLAALIFALVFTAVGVTIIGKMNEKTKKGYDKETCRQSVIWNSKGRLPILRGQEFPIDCPTRYVTFENEKTIIESRNFRTEEKYKTFGKVKSNKEKFLMEANAQIAKLLYECWYQFGAGRLEVLDARDERRQCVICSRFEFSKEVQEAFKDTKGEPLRYTSYYNPNDPDKDYTLLNYLISNSTNTPFNKLTYYEYIMDPLDVFEKPEYDYSIMKSYAIVFIALNEHSFSKTFYEGVKTSWNAIVKRKLSTESSSKEGEDFVNIMDMMPYDKVKARCDALA